MNALDLSTPSGVTPTWCSARLTDGFELLVVCLWTGGTAPEGAEPGAAGVAFVWRADCGLLRVVSTAIRLDQNAGAEWERLSFVAVVVEEIDEVAGALGGCSLEQTNGN
jgi:hypothetical protein